MDSRAARSNTASLIAGAILMTAVPAVIYSLVSYEPDLLFPYFFVVLAVAAILTLCLFLPIAGILAKLGTPTLSATVIATFAGYFLVFLAWNYSSLSSAISVIERKQTLVLNGAITPAGYLSAAKDSAITAAIASIGALLFWLVSTRQIFRPSKRGRGE